MFHSVARGWGLVSTNQVWRGRAVASEDESDDRSLSAVSVRGDLACLSAFELLQTMHFLRKCGSLRLETHDTRGRPREAACTMATEGLVDASCGRLQGREAVLDFTWWKQGEFVFESMPYYSAPDAIPLQEVLLDAVRLADEIEVRAEILPDRTALLVIGTDQAVIDLDPIPAVPEIVSFLSEHAGASRSDLERALPFAPVTLGFALARMCEEGRVRGVLEEGPSPLGTAATRIEPVTPSERSATIFRLVLAFVPAAHELVSDLISHLRQDLGCDQASIFFDPSGVSFVRLRPPKQPLLSITALPIAFRNRFVFESLLPSLELAVFLSDDRPSGELDEWRRLVSPSSDTFCTSDSRSALEDVLEALRAAEE